MNLSDAARRFGLVEKETERSLLLIGDTPESFTAISPLIVDLLSRDSRVRLLLSSANPRTLAELAGNPWKLRVVSLPIALSPAGNLFLDRLNVRTVAFIEPFDDAAYRALARSAAIQAVATMILKRKEPIRPVGDRLLAIMARDLKALRRENGPLRSIGSGLLRVAKSETFKSAIAWRIRRYQNLEELKARLDSPRAIMCLGNGPSSEDKRLAEYRCDALFRVNHSWLDRGLFTKPDVVFTGGRPTMKAVSGAVFGLQGADAEIRIATARGLNPLIGGTEYFDVNDVAPSLRQFEWGHLRPTNGASMLAAAVALAPERLIVAGIDLFRHPDGSYPGDTATANAYSPGHTRETELGFLLSLFARYEGELAIVGDILEREWRRHRTETETAR